MVLIPGIIKHIFLKRERARGREKRGWGGQIGANWAQMGDAMGFSDALPQMLLQLFLFKKLESISLNYRIFKKLKFLGVFVV